MAYEVGVAGQSVMGALDQLVTAVSGEMFTPAGPEGGAVPGVADVGGACGASHGSVAGGWLVRW